MGLFKNLFSSSSPGSIVANTVSGAIDGVADIVDRFVETPEEKQKMHLALKEFALKEAEQAMEKDAAILKDRQGAREMAGVHGKLQKTFAVIFLIGYLAILLVDLAFIGFLVWLAIRNQGIDIPQWITALVGSTLGSVTTGMSLKLDQIIGFLFGGSAGGDQSGAALAKIVEDSGRNQNTAESVHNN